VPAAVPDGEEAGQQLMTWPFLGGLAVIFLAGLLVAGRYAFYYGIPFADTYTYLAPGRNLLQGRGFITRFNVVHGWSGRLDHPGLAYYNPLYGLTLAIIWQVLGNAGHVGVVATALPCCINAVLLALLVRRAFGALTAVLSAVGYLLIPSTWQGLALITAEHPAVTIVLVCLLIIQYYAPRHPRSWLWLGVLLGVGCLVKVTVGLVIPGLVVAVFLTQNGTPAQRTRASLRPTGMLALGVAGVLVPFALFCRLTVGEFYPSYPAMAQNWSLATQYGGHYVAESPAVKPDAARVPRARDRIVIVLDNVGTFARALWGELGVLSLAAVLAFVGAGKEARRQAIFLIGAGVSLALGHAASFNWFRLAWEPSSLERYVLYLAALWYPVAVYGIVRSATWLKSAVVRDAAVTVVWLVISLPAIGAGVSSVRQIAQMTEPRFTRLQQVMVQSARLVGPDDLVAVAGGGLMICGAVFLDRPVVAFPQGRMDTPPALREFIDVYNPALVIPASNRSADRVLPQMGYQLEYLEGFRGVRVYVRKR
jgi:4-amino-4-deoxy-L-arabinose transferase-like glycosyltransferase